MRKSKYISGCLLAVLLLFAAGLILDQARDAWAASLTNTKKTYVDKGQPPLTVYTLTQTMDSGGTNSTAMTIPITGRVVAVRTNPGTTAPSDNYDIDLLVDGYDIMGAALDNRDTANTEWALPLLGTAVWEPILRADTVTVSSSGNTTKNATVVIDIYVEGY